MIIFGIAFLDRALVPAWACKQCSFPLQPVIKLNYNYVRVRICNLSRNDCHKLPHCAANRTLCTDLQLYTQKVVCIKISGKCDL